MFYLSSITYSNSPYAMSQLTIIFPSIVDSLFEIVRAQQKVKTYKGNAIKVIAQNFTNYPLKKKIQQRATINFMSAIT